MATAVEILTEARSYIERGWCQGSYATDATGEPRLEEQADAANWCMSGATLIAGAHGRKDREATYRAREILNRVIDPSGITCMTSWNDAPGRTKAEVLAAFDHAIELAKAAP